MFNKVALLKIAENGRFRSVRAAIRELKRETGLEYAVLSNGDRILLENILSVDGISI